MRLRQLLTARRLAAGLIVTIGVALAMAHTRHAMVMRTTVGVVTEALVPLALALAVVVLGLWLAVWDGPRVGVRIVLRSAVLGLVLFSVIGVWILSHAFIRGHPLEHGEFLLANVATVGTLVGGLVGVYETRTLMAEAEAEESRDRLLFLNNLLRHHVLNGVQVIRGTLDCPPEDVGPAQLDLVDERADRIAALVGEVSALSRAFTGAVDRHPVDLERAVTSAVVVVSKRHPTADIDLAVSSLTVRANDHLPVVFEHLLANAIEHHDRELPYVRLTAEREGDTATIRVADDGPGISPEHRESLFERHERVDQHMGLYLVATLVEWWDGSVDIDDNEPRGTVVTVRLPLATPSDEQGPMSTAEQVSF